MIKKHIARLVYICVAKHLPSSCSKLNLGQKKLRYWCAKNFVHRIEENVNIERGAVFSSKVAVGKNSGIGVNAYIQGCVYIGENVMMGPECNIWTINHRTERIDIPMCEQGVQVEKPVYIGNDVWIGSRVTILPGVKIGNGTIIGAGAVVSNDVPDYAVVVGNPARVVRYRTHQEMHDV